MIVGTPPGTPRTPPQPVQPPLTDREAQLARDRKAASVFTGKNLPSESDCKPLFRYLNGQCPFDDVHAPDAAAGKAMLDYCMKTYRSLGPLRHVMSCYPFTLKVKPLDYDVDSAAALQGELARWNILYDVEAVIGDVRPHSEEHLANFLSGAGCSVRTLTVRCEGKLDPGKLNQLGVALASCPLKNFELVAMAASDPVARLLEAVRPLESLTVVGDFSGPGDWMYRQRQLVMAGARVPRFKACLDTQSCDNVLCWMCGLRRPGWEFDLCEWKPTKNFYRPALQDDAFEMLRCTKGMTHAGFAIFKRSAQGSKVNFGPHSSLLTFNTLKNAPDDLPPDLQSLFVSEPGVQDQAMAADLANHRAKHFASKGIARGALSGVAQAVAAANRVPPDVAKHIEADLAGTDEISWQQAGRYVMVTKLSYAAALRERDREFLEWLVRAWQLNRIEPKEVAAGLAGLATPFQLSSAFPELAVEKLGREKGNQLAEAMAPITAQKPAPEQINPQQIV